ncbi:MAG: N-formylglutamate amidohydrolase [Rhodobacterales bacterium]|nr:MAG: N-formylglutamate amidohydrolase [Rhodobacterales bacterium]
MTTPGLDPVSIHNAKGAAPVVLVCEHASRLIPERYKGLGLDAEARRAHIAWDIGALDVAQGLATRMDAPLVAGGVSRLVYDCNRPLEAHDAIPPRSEIYDIPGNRDLSDADRQARCAAIHDPFHEAVSEVIDAKADPALITIHSFTPIYKGARRALDLGFLFHGDHDALAQSALAAEQEAGRYTARLNEPYDASDGVTYSLARHGVARGLPALMIEIRNDLIDTPETADTMADHLSQTLTRALSVCNPGKEPRS